MNISIIGTGYVGLVTGAALSELGMKVICMDSDQAKIDKLKLGIMPIYEPGLEQMVINNYRNTKRLGFTTDMKEAVEFARVIFIAVGTPVLDDDSIDLASVYNAAREAARHIDGYKVIVSKSTVPVGTGKRVREEIAEIMLRQNNNCSFDVVSNPEFLREGSAVSDFMNPDRIIIGTESEKALRLMKEIYGRQIRMGTPLITTSIETSEMVKYASNAFLAAKISFINEIADMCELCGADITVVSKAMGLDARIGPSFLSAGPGFGGSCLPKDAKGLVAIGRSLGYVPRIVKSSISVNQNQRKLMVGKIKKAAGGFRGKTIAILGLAFKPDTDDIREAPSIYIINALLEGGAKVRVYDPRAMDNVRKLYPGGSVICCDDAYSACRDSDCIVLVTEWRELTALDFTQLKSIVRTPVFIDLRNAYQPEYVRSFGFVYRGVGRK